MYYTYIWWLWWGVVYYVFIQGPEHNNEKAEDLPMFQVPDKLPEGWERVQKLNPDAAAADDGYSYRVSPPSCGGETDEGPYNE